MIDLKGLKNSIKFTIDAEILTNLISRVKAVSEYGLNTSLQKDNFFIVKGGVFYTLGYSQDVVAYISHELANTSDGICCVDFDTVLGLLKKRKGDFQFSVVDSELRFVSKRYSGNIDTKGTTKEALSETLSLIETDNTKNILRSEMLTDIKRAVKNTSITDIVFRTPLNINIDFAGGLLRVSSNDGYHAAIYKSKKEYKGKDFRLSVTGVAYSIIDKFVSGQAVHFSIGNTLRLAKKDLSIFASIPPIQHSDDDYAVFDTVDSVMNQTPKASFTIGKDLFTSIENMYVLQKASVESSSNFDFVLTKNQLQVSFKTTTGTITETIDCESKGKAKFSIGERVLVDLLSLFSSFESVEFVVNEDSFYIRRDDDEFETIGMGSLDG